MCKKVFFSFSLSHFLHRILSVDAWSIEKIANGVVCFIGLANVHDVANQKHTLHIVGHKIIVRFSWFIAFARRSYFVLLFSIGLFNFTFSKTETSLWNTIRMVTRLNRFSMNLCECVTVCMCVLQCLLISIHWNCRTHDFIRLFMYDLKRIVMNVNKALFECHNSHASNGKWSEMPNNHRSRRAKDLKNELFSCVSWFKQFSLHHLILFENYSPNSNVQFRNEIGIALSANGCSIKLTRNVIFIRTEINIAKKENTWNVLCTECQTDKQTTMTAKNELIT